MDHTVYERKNTDLGSTSMTKSGGFSIKKRHRKLGALIGLAALAVPFAANLGTLGDAIHAVTGPQNVYESKLLNVKLETSQDKAKTTWDLEFDRSDMSVSEQTVKFKLDLEKAGLTDAEIAVKDGDKLGEPLDMREGIVDAVLKTQSTHLILTAISSNEDKHDITLPVTELGLYNEENGENLLPADNRSVDLTMAFEQVAEIAKESSSETVTEAVAKEEKKAEVKSEEKTAEVKEEKQAEKAPRVVPSNNGFVPYGNADPAKWTGSQIGGTEVTSIVMKSRQFTTPQTNSEATDPNNFQIWSNRQYTRQVQTSTTGTVTHDPNAAIEIRQKLGLDSGTIDGYKEGSAAAHIQNVRTHYHAQYEQTDPQPNRSSYLIEFQNASQVTGSAFTVVYDNVGVYVDANGDEHQIGATLHLSNIVAVDGMAQDNRGVWDGTHHFIDVPNNLYSGLIYQGIRSLDVTLQFFTVEGGQFTNIINVQNDSADTTKASITFDSLNNFGTTTNHGTVNQWDATAYGINSAQFAESAAKVVGNTLDWNSARTAKAGTAMVQDNSLANEMKGEWYSTAHGHYTTDPQYPVSSMAMYDNDPYDRWVDVAESNTFERGSINCPITGTTNTFRLFSGTGNTWQTLTSTQINPVALPEPYKTVTDKTDYGSALAELDAYTSGSTKQAGDYDGESVSQAGTFTKNNTSYFVHNYWVFQPTYTVGDESIAKSNKIVMTDLLPEGMTLRDYDLSDTPVTIDSQQDVSVIVPTGTGTTTPLIRQTNSAANDYSVRVEKDADEPTRQRVTVTFTDAGIGKTVFNGDDIGFSLRVKVDVMSAINAKSEVVWENQAEVITGVSDEKTNKVTTHLDPLDANIALKIHKVDGDGRSLSGADFTLTRQTEYTNWNGTTFDTPTKSELEITPASKTADTWTFDNSVSEGADGTPGEPKLKPGTYKLSETQTPDGWTGIADIVFTLNYVRANPSLTPEDDHYDDLKMVITLPSGTTWNTFDIDTGVQVDVPNGEKEAKVKLIKKDADGNELSGAQFQYRMIVNDQPEATWHDLDANGAIFTMKSGEQLDYDRPSKKEVMYEVKETQSPDGYALDGSIYFKVVPKSDYGLYSNLTAPLTDVALLATNAEGIEAYGWASMDEVDGIFIGTFEVQNNPKSIFPRVGGTGIQAYIGAGLIVMLIAGGAAWYIKRRQNQ